MYAQSGLDTDSMGYFEYMQYQLETWAEFIQKMIANIVTTSTLVVFVFVAILWGLGLIRNVVRDAPLRPVRDIFFAPLRMFIRWLHFYLREFGIWVPEEEDDNQNIFP